MDSENINLIDNETDGLERKQKHSLMQKALLELTPKFRLPLILHYIKGALYEEISEIMNIPLGTVQSRIKRGKEKLRDIILEKYGTILD